MKERTVFCVIADELGTEVTQVRLGCKLNELGNDGIQNLIKLLAEDNLAWRDVMFNKRIAVIFDAESGDKISLNRKSIKFTID